MKQGFFATCPKGIEQLLAAELNDLGAENTRETVAGVSFECDLAGAYRVCLWSRVANKILMPLTKFPVETAQDLYEGVKALDWQEHMDAEGHLWIDFSGTNTELRNTQFSAQKLKDAIVDHMRDAEGARPSIDRETPDLIVNARLSKGQLTINLDLCGESLHRRGYRADSVKAPLKENLAAALLLRSRWPEVAQQQGTLIDPMCGSGTFLFEAALIAADIAPGLGRCESPDREFAFQRWLQYDPSVWQPLQDEAAERKRLGVQRALPQIFGYDENVLAIRATERNLYSIGLADWVKVRRKPLQEFTLPTHKALTAGLLITNPPYGERLSDELSLRPLYRRLGDVLKSDFVGWRAAVFTGNPSLGRTMGLRAQKKYKFFNGAIPTELLLFEVSEDYFVKSNRSPDSDNFTESKSESRGEIESQGRGNSSDGGAVDDKHVETELPDPHQALSDNAGMVANRLRKNLKQLKSWRKQNQIECFRLYDADIPEYAAAVDVYRDCSSGDEYFHVQEYVPPKSIDPNVAQIRFNDLIHAVVSTFDLSPEKLSIKQRKRTKGSDQYQALNSDPFDGMLQVREGQAQLLVNLQAYLDTGLFLDHRPLRKRVFESAQGKRVLNLFCYTSSVTVQAIRGGASSSVSVDMSHTYIEWARKNFQLNDVDERKHQLVQSDCITWLNSCRQPFDLIVLDPPSFSNSKRMEGVLDIQRDHVGLIRRCVELLAPGGCLFFSNNFRRFKLDEKGLDKYSVDDITAETIDKDFQRNPKIHRCWKILEKT